MATRFPVENIEAPASALTDHSGKTEAQKSVTIMQPLATARRWRIQNLDRAASLWFNDTGGAAAPGAAGSYELVPGAYYEFSSPLAVSVYADVVLSFSAARY